MPGAGDVAAQQYRRRLSGAPKSSELRRASGVGRGRLGRLCCLFSRGCADGGSASGEVGFARALLKEAGHTDGGVFGGEAFGELLRLADHGVGK